MNDSEFNQKVEAAQAYEALHVPALFQQWSAPLVKAARVSSGHRFLDVACGTGILAREALGVVGKDGFVAGVDPDRGMLAVAEELAPEIEWRRGTADDIPYEDDDFDVVASQFGMMFFPDREAAVGEMLRVTRPGGSLAVAVWDSLENSPGYREEVELLQRVAGQDAADALRAPFVLGDAEGLASLFEGVGARSVRVETRTGTARFPDIRTQVEADLRGWLPVMGVQLDEETIERILAEAESVLARYVTDGGRVEFDAPAHIVSGRSPD